MINDMSRQFMLDHFDVDNGIKCRVGHKWRYTGKFYPVGYPGQIYQMRRLDESDFLISKTLHVFDHIFDEDIGNVVHKSQVRDHIIGVAPVIDIDSPKIEGGNKRYDCLADNDVVELFEETRQCAKKQLETVGEWDNCRMMFSGNGIYFVLGDYFGDVDTHDRCFIDLCDNVNYLMGQEMVDITSTYPWNRYHKIPFTLHMKYNRLAIPLDKDSVLDQDYLIQNSGLWCDVGKVIGDSKWS